MVNVRMTRNRRKNFTSPKETCLKQLEPRTERNNDDVNIEKKDSKSKRRRKRGADDVHSKSFSESDTWNMSTTARNPMNTKSILKLLYNREIGNRDMTWFALILKRRIPEPDVLMPRRMEWKPFIQRSIPFSRLKTPKTDAVLALDRNGTYMVSIAGTKFEGQGALTKDEFAKMLSLKRFEFIGFYPYLTLRYYAVPSPSVLASASKQSINAKQVLLSPCILTIPLLLDTKSDKNSRSLSPLVGIGESPIMTIPVKILMSYDGILGVAFVSKVPSSHSFFAENPRSRSIQNMVRQPI